MRFGSRDGSPGVIFELDNGISIVVSEEVCGGFTVMTVPADLAKTTTLTEELHTHNDSELIRQLAEIANRPPPIFHG